MLTESIRLNWFYYPYTKDLQNDLLLIYTMDFHSIKIKKIIRNLYSLTKE